MSKTNSGNFFEDFQIGQVIAHATPRTVTDGRHRALHRALRPALRRAVLRRLRPRRSAIRRSPVDDLLVFHIVFGKTVPDISLNAVANLGYADCRFLAPVYPGDTLSATSEVIGLKENSNGQTGVVYVRSRGRNQKGGRGARLCALGDGAQARPERPAPAESRTATAARAARRSSSATRCR